MNEWFQHVPLTTFKTRTTLLCSRSSCPLTLLSLTHILHYLTYLWYSTYGIFVGYPRNSLPSPKQPIFRTLKHLMSPFISWMWHDSALYCFLKRSLKQYVYDNISCLQVRELGIYRTRLGVRVFCVFGFMFVFCLLFCIVWIMYYVNLFC